MDDPTTFEAWSGPIIDGPAHPMNFWQSEEISKDVSAMSRDMLVIAFYFSPLNVNQICFPDRTVDSPCTLFTFT